MSRSGTASSSSGTWGWILAALFAGLLLGGVAAVATITGVWSADEQTVASPTDSSPTESAASPTPSSTEPTAVATDPSVAPADATVTVTTAYWDESQNSFVVSANVNAIVSGGTCTAIALSAEERHEVSGPALPGASSTDCGTLKFVGDQLSTGTWTIMVLFESADYEGISEEVTGVVP